MLYGTMLASQKLTCSADEGCEMRMLRYMYGHTRRDKLRMKILQTRLVMPSMVDKLGRWKLRWFGHIKRSVDMPY